jgi:hypothetical protein
MNQPSTVERTAPPVGADRAVRGMPALARECVCGALTALPALTEAAVSIGRCATGDASDFRWLAPTMRSWLARLPWPFEVQANYGHAAPLPPASLPTAPPTAANAPDPSADAG